MKKILFESFREYLMNEAFGSDIIRDIYTENKKFWGSTAKRLGIALDKIEDKHLSRYDKDEFKEARKAAKEGAIIFWMSGIESENKLLGISVNDWVLLSPGYYRGGRSGYRPEYKSVLSMSKDADFAWTLEPAIVKQFGVQKLRSERWAEKHDALAFKDNWSIASENIDRYKTKVAELRKEKVKGDLDIQKALSDIMDMYKKMFDDLLGSPDWHAIQKLNKKISDLMKMFETITWYERDEDKYQHQHVEMHNNIIKIKKLLKEVDEYNAAQTEGE